MNKMVKLKPYCQKIGSGVTPRGGDRVYSDSGISLVRSQNIYNGFFARGGLAYINGDIAQKMKGVTLEKDDILLNITGDSVARCCLLPETILPARVSQHVSIIRTNKDKLNPRFLMYYLISPIMQSRMLSLAGSGGTRKALTKEIIENIEIPFVKYKTQEVIANGLSNYDNLIDNNRRRIQLLEEAARLLYREWFVYMRFPGHEKVKRVNGLPDGWKKTRTDENFTTVLGGTPSRLRVDYWEDGDVPWINSGKVNELRVIEPSEMITENGLRNSSTKIMSKGTTIIAITGATLGQISMLEIECAANQSVVGIIDPTKLYNEWIYLTMKHRVSEIVGRATGGAQVHINKDVINAFEMLLPNRCVAGIFKKQAEPLFRQIAVLLFENKKLTQARDLLLPRLMDGRIEVK